MSAEDLLRTLAPQVVGVLTRRYGDFGAAEDAVQEALLAAATQWPREGVPGNPRGWLIQVASRRMTEQVRGEQARRRREDLVARQVPADRQSAPPADSDESADRDDSLILLFLCCHPALSPTAAIALTLRCVGGLTTAEIARAFMVPEATMGQRISRAKQRIKASGIPFLMPDDKDRERRLDAVLHVLYLIFNEGYATGEGPELQRVELSREAIRLTRAAYELLPDDCEVAGLLALMLLTHARSAARTGPDGELIPLAEQDRDRWDDRAIEEGTALITATLPKGPLGPYQVQAAIAAVHDEAGTAEDTDWPQILALYGVLEQLGANPVVSLNRAVAVAMVRGPEAGLGIVESLDKEGRLTGNHRLSVVRAHLLEMAGDRQGAVENYREAARRTTSLPERDYLTIRAARLATAP
ncbi:MULTISPECIES: sigma-70 family RNA polymerase sigma factor [unclassified Streptomyces]|uniref:RNA polymerase sigma factor n=1 Tax=unclassified Streptomyces TaxID=2593676 RepID=UPI00081E612E|nr:MULTISPECIES: sigma-70 family RNA polymerase sigma factor [unclassified Streptomyces]MYZ38864.1 sigma-70 family RNA polymerase sigma factor [Streptomyces sp. SID4917]SCG00790.1 RNA polymerase, sigma subunit, ECF family [Streptomyces sp. MnatMP-M17]